VAKSDGNAGAQAGTASRAMTSKDILAVQSRLLAGTSRVGLEPPPGWRAWSLPASALSIDVAVLGDRNTSGLRLLDRETLAAAGVACPEWAARHYLFAGVLAGDAARGAEDSRRFRADLLRAAAVDAAAVRSALTEFYKRYLAGGEATHFGWAWQGATEADDVETKRAVGPAIQSAANQIAPLVSFFEQVEGLAQRALTKNAPDPMEAEIGSSLAECFHALTSKQPSTVRDGPFELFFKTALESLPEDFCSISYRAAERGIKLRKARLSAEIQKSPQV